MNYKALVFTLIFPYFAFAQEFSVVGGCRENTENISHYKNDIENQFIAVANSQPIREHSSHTCENLKVIDQWLTYTSITLTSASLLTYTLSSLELKSLIAASGMANPVVGVLTILGGTTIYIVFKANLDDCKAMEERILKEKVERALRSNTNLTPIRSNLPVQFN